MKSKDMPAMPMMSDDYEVQSASDTLLKAEEIKSNKELMKKVHAHMAKKKKHITSVAQLRQIAAEKAESPEEETSEPAAVEKSEPMEAPIKKKKA